MNVNQPSVCLECRAIVQPVRGMMLMSHECFPGSGLQSHCVASSVIESFGGIEDYLANGPYRASDIKELRFRPLDYGRKVHEKIEI